jgi:hypothetical protein
VSFTQNFGIPSLFLSILLIMSSLTFAKEDAICKKINADKLPSVETKIGTVCKDGDKDSNCISESQLRSLKLLHPLPTKDPNIEELINEKFDVAAAVISLGDNHRLLKIGSMVGSQNCHRYYIYEIKDDGTFRKIEKGFDLLSEEGGICQTKTKFFSFKGKTYFNYDQKMFTVDLLGLKQICGNFPKLID